MIRTHNLLTAFINNIQSCCLSCCMLYSYYLFILKLINLDFPGGPVVKNLTANTEDMGSVPALGGLHMPWSN